MKKYFISILGMMVAMSCDHMPKSLSGSSADDEEEQQEEFDTKKVTYNFEQEGVIVDIKADYPTAGDKVLCNAIAECISEELGGTCAKSLDDGRTVMDYYGENKKSELLSDAIVTNDGDTLGSEYKMEIVKGYETDHIVTFIFSGYTYSGGAAHGLESQYGVTFRKSDGRRFGREMMRDTYTNRWYQQTKDGLKRYFSKYSNTSVSTDSELKTYILTDDDVNYLPMPAAQPYITEEGVTFTYQPYEISFYGAGTPTYSIPLKDAEPFLKQTAKDMLGL